MKKDEAEEDDDQDVVVRKRIQTGSQPVNDQKLYDPGRVFTPAPESPSAKM